MLQITDLQMRYSADFSLQVPDWQARSGQLHALLGPNGAGKTSLLRMLAGERPDRGEVRLHGVDLQDWQPQERARHLAVLSQSPEMGFAFSAGEVVALGLTPLSLGRQAAQQQVRQAMEATDTAHLKAKNFLRLSGGERQRVHLARVLLQLSQAESEPLLLLDEPTSAQDLGQQHRMMEQVRTLCREKHWCIVAILHDLNLALRYSDDCLLLQGGQVVAAGPPEEVLQPANIERHWNYPGRLVHSPCGAAFIF